MTCDPQAYLADVLDRINETLFSTIDQARMALATWRADYNNSRPYSDLGRRTPNEFAKTFPRRGQIKPPERTSKWTKIGGKVNKLDDPVFLIRK